MNSKYTLKLSNSNIIYYLSKGLFLYKTIYIVYEIVHNYFIRIFLYL